MELPTIIFRRSRLYDQALARNPEWKNLPEEQLEEKFEKIQKEWKQHERNLLKAISEATNLPWNEKEIVVYFSYNVIPFSDPLTINGGSDIHTITHELIHRILSEPKNYESIDKNWKRLMSKYSHEDRICAGHVPVHAIHLSILKRYFDEETVGREIVSVEHPSYKRAWEIVQAEGYQSILNELTKGLPKLK